MTTRPTDLPTWAESASATVVEPSNSKQLGGWDFQEPPPHSWLNWFWRQTARWAEHFATSASKFSTLEDAVNASAASGPLVAGDTFILNEDDNTRSPGASTDEEILGAGRFAVGTIAVTGKSVVAYVDGAGGGLKATTRDNGTVIRTFTLTNPIGTGAIALDSDGVYVAIAYDTKYVELFNYETGLSEWVFDNTNAVTDVVIGTDHVYMVGSDTASVACRAISIALGTATWSYDHGAQLETVAFAGRQLLIGGAASVFASTAKFRSIESATGKDLANEGGLGTSTEPWVWDNTFGVFDAARQIVTDGRIWAIKHSNQIVRTGGLADGVVGIASGPMKDFVKQISIDQEMIYVTTDSGANVGEVYALTKDLLHTSWSFQNTETDQGMFAIASDGAAVFAARPNGLAGTGRCYKIVRGNTAGIWRISDPETSEFLPLRQLATPAQGN